MRSPPSAECAQGPARLGPARTAGQEKNGFARGGLAYVPTVQAIAFTPFSRGGGPVLQRHASSATGPMLANDWELTATDTYRTAMVSSARNKPEHQVNYIHLAPSPTQFGRPRWRLWPPIWRANPNTGNVASFRVQCSGGDHGNGRGMCSFRRPRNILPKEPRMPLGPGGVGEPQQCPPGFS